MTAFGWPQWQVLAGFGQSPNGATVAGATTDITRYVNSIDVSQGRDYELARAAAKTAPMRLINIDGRFDPANGAGAYSPNVKLFTPLWVQAVYNSVTYKLWGGAIERWPQEWTDPAKGWSGAQGVDMLAMLSQITLKSCYQQEVLLDAPLAFWPLTDSSGSSSASNIVAGGKAATIGTSKYGAGTLTFGASTTLADSVNGVTFASPDAGTSSQAARGTYLAIPNIVPASSAFTIEFWVNLATPPAFTETILSTVSIQSGLSAIFIKLGTSGKVVTTIIGTTGTCGPASASSVCDGAWHHVAFQLQSDGKTGALFVDGVLQLPTSASATLVGYVPTLPTLSIGLEVAAQSGGSQVTWEPLGGSITGLAIYGTQLSLARIKAHYNAGINAMSGETSDARITRLLAYAGFTGVAPSDIGTGQQVMSGATGLAGQSALSAVQAVTDSEQGVLYIAGTGALTFRGRWDRLNKRATTWIIGDAVGEQNYAGSPAIDFDPTYVYNDVEVTRAGGAKSVATDATSQTAYFPRTLSLTNLSSTDQDAADEASFLLSRYKDPHDRVGEVEFSPGANSALWPFILGAAVGDRVTFNRRPKAATAKSFQGFIESIRHAITATSWKTTMQISPLFTDYGLIASLRTTLGAAASSGATSITIAPYADKATNPLQANLMAGRILTIDPTVATREAVIVTSVPSTSTGYGNQVIGVVPVLGTLTSITALKATDTGAVLQFSVTWTGTTGSKTLCIDGEIMTATLTNGSPVATITARGVGTVSMAHAIGATVYAGSGGLVNNHGGAAPLTDVIATTAAIDPTQWDAYAVLDTNLLISY